MIVKDVLIINNTIMAAISAGVSLSRVAIIVYVAGGGKYYFTSFSESELEFNL